MDGDQKCGTSERVHGRRWVCDTSDAKRFQLEKAGRCDYLKQFDRFIIKCTNKLRTLSARHSDPRWQKFCTLVIDKIHQSTEEKWTSRTDSITHIWHGNPRNAESPSNGSSIVAHLSNLRVGASAQRLITRQKKIFFKRCNSLLIANFLKHGGSCDI